MLLKEMDKFNADYLKIERDLRRHGPFGRPNDHVVNTRMLLIQNNAISIIFSEIITVRI